MTYDLLDPERIDFIDGSIYVEQKPGKGEDAIIAGSDANCVYAGVFDGCGGSGAQNYSMLGDSTGAYIASRVTAKVFEDWFRDGFYSCTGQPAAVKNEIVRELTDLNGKYGENSRLGGNLRKTFPTTVAAAICTSSGGALYLDYYWAGDSRVYILDDGGLHQLTEDELAGVDVRNSLTTDGVLTNVVSLSSDFHINHGRRMLVKPSIVLTGTDGCFGYFDVPMDLEYYLLDTMLSSQSINEWLGKMKEIIGDHAGDDYSLGIFSVGFAKSAGGSAQDVFGEAIKPVFRTRHSMIAGFTSENGERSDEENLALWRQYQTGGYLAYITPAQKRGGQE